ncbi:uncharacterized protein LOC113639463 isoform X2 [Tachysurus fulvidraco]|uniref:uncharacterized protein LOC113639463 isoform X2 n=1 Tax=Tachysurus fulvidraco TaxID=1234273 RepID=UPI001FEE6D40|nr:uncharacterized protein LOC113639463 isoform X2 [Tachysurus fulvidraco]
MLHMKTFLSGRSSGTVRGLACAAGLIALTTAGYYAYRRLKRTSDRRAAEREAAQGSVVGVDVEEVLVCTEEDPQTSAVVLLSHHHGTRQLHSAWQTIQFLSSQSCSFVCESMEVRRYIACLVRGPEVLLWWITTTTEMSSNHWGAFNSTIQETSITCIQRVCGSVRALVSCHHEETTIHVPYEDGEQTIYQVSRLYLRVDVDGQVDMSHEEEGSFFTPYADSEAQSEFEENDMELPLEEQEVPFISLYLTGRGITDLVLKLPAVREAFSRMMASMHNKNFLYVAGKQILMRLAAANKQDPRGVQRAYDELIRFLREPSYQEMIKAEVLDAQLYHFNLLDVFFELVFFSCLINGLPPGALDGGFLQHVFDMNSQWDVDIREPEADQLFLLLSLKLTLLLEELFSQPLDLYSDPAALATAVLRLVKEHVQEMLKAMAEV